MVTYAVGGKDYPLALTLGAMTDLDTLCGGFEHVSAAFDGKTTIQVIDTAVKMLAILMRGGYAYLSEMGENPPDPPKETVLLSLLQPKDIGSIKMAIFRAMSESMGQSVEVEADQKNGETTRDE